VLEGWGRETSLGRGGAGSRGGASGERGLYGPERGVTVVGGAGLGLGGGRTAGAGTLTHIPPRFT